MYLRLAYVWWGLCAIILIFGLIALLQISLKESMMPGLWLLWLWNLLFVGFVGFRLYHQSQSTWHGMWLLMLMWSVFPLLRPINNQLIHWHADDLLRYLDEGLWGGKSLPAQFVIEQYPILADCLSVAYFLFFFLVIGCALYYCLIRHYASCVAFFNGLARLYIVGFIGYFALPAAGPAFTYLPLSEHIGGWISQKIIAIVANGVTGMDVFPSLHTAITLYVVGFFSIEKRYGFMLLLSPLAVGIVAATIALRYHYGIDVLFGIVLAGIVLFFSYKDFRNVATVSR